MVQRFFLDRVYTETTGSAVADQLDLIIQSLAHIAQATLTLLQAAVPRTQITLQLPIVKLVPVTR